jgi:hypothetical protein
MTTPQAPPAPGQHQQTNGQAPVLAAWPFAVGVLSTENLSDYDQLTVMTAATQKLPDVRIQPDGWLRGVWFDINVVAAGNAATVAYTEDGLAAIINTVLFRDTGGEQIFGPFGSYDWLTANKFGGYQAQGDPRADLNYSATTGSGATAGTGHITLYLPLQISAADSLGAVENRSENSIYRVELTLAASTAVYSTAPTTLPTVEIKTTQDSYTEPVAAMTLSGRSVSTAPPSPGTLQYWKQENSLVPAATTSVLITNGIGNGYRNIVFKLMRSAGTRANGEADWPDPLEVTLGTSRTRLYGKLNWRDKLSRTYQYFQLTADTSLGKENGVFPMWFTQDVTLMPGDEARRMYQRTKTGNTYKIRGTWGNAGTLFITTNYVVPRGNDFSQVVA